MPELIGHQLPRLESVPPYVSSAGQEAIKLARTAGLHLDPWQQHVLTESLGEDAAGRWSAFEVGLIVSRQNGKGGALEARVLAGLFLFGEQLILWSAHEFKTAQEAFRRVLALIEGTPALKKRIKPRGIRTSHGEEGIELTTGQRLRFVARSRGSGRGFSGDLVILDEAMILDDDAMAALLPTLSARPNPQLWYTGSAGEKSSLQLARVRRRGLTGKDPSLAFFEWSVDDADDHADPDSWAKANPGLGIRISVEHVARERAAMSAEKFARERLGVGDYPVEQGEAWSVIPQSTWIDLSDPESRISGPVCIAADITPERDRGSIAVAGLREDKKPHVEVVDHRTGTAWMVSRIADLAGRWTHCGVVVDPSSPAGMLISGLEQAGFQVVASNAVADRGKLALVKTTAREVGQAFGQFMEAATDTGTLRHIDQPPLNAAVAGAQTRRIGDAKAWARLATSVDISPLVACTLALWGYSTRAHLAASAVSAYETRGLVQL